MFTGLVAQKGLLVSRTSIDTGQRLEFFHELGPLQLGESVSVSGACLTVVAFRQQHFSADVSSETLQRTTLGHLQTGHPVNLERAVAVGDRLGGHLVTGHVDGVGEVDHITTEGEMTRVGLFIGRELGRYAAQKGSITIDGVSLTINSVSDDRVELLLIPHTRSVTTLGQLTVGSPVNVEVDLVARYVERLLSTRS